MTKTANASDLFFTVSELVIDPSASFLWIILRVKQGVVVQKSVSAGNECGSHLQNCNTVS